MILCGPWSLVVLPRCASAVLALGDSGSSPTHGLDDAVGDERLPEPVELVVVLGVVDLVVEVEFAHLEEGRGGEERVGPCLM